MKLPIVQDNLPCSQQTLQEMTSSSQTKFGTSHMIVSALFALINKLLRTHETVLEVLADTY